MSDALQAETSIGRVALCVGDLDGVVDFYRSVVGLPVLDRSDGRAVLGAQRPLLVLEGAPDAPARPREAAGLFHTAIRVPDREALADALARIDEQWRLTGASDHRVSEALYLEDPEGNGVEIYRDRPRSEWPTAEGRVQMATLPLDLDALRAESTGTAAVPPETDVGHVHLEVTELSAARDFYVEALGLAVRQAYNGALFVAAGEYHHHVGLNVWNGRSAPATGRGLAWFELVVPEQTVSTLRERLADAGVAVTETDDGIAVTDPDSIDVRIAGR